MLRILAVTVILGLLSALEGQARIFNNPILDSDNPDPGAILVDGVYYITATSSGNPPEKFPIYTSTDLNSWTLAGHAFTDGVNLPVWFVLFFTALATEFGIIFKLCLLVVGRREVLLRKGT